MPQRVTLTTRKALDLTVAGPPSDCASNCPKIPNNALACISVDLLGGLRVRAGKRTMGSRELGGTKLRRVLLALILHRGAPVSKDRLVSMLWEGTPPSGAKATLETYVCVLRKTLQPCHEVRTSLITTAAGCASVLRAFAAGSTAGVSPAGGILAPGHLRAHASIEGFLSFVVPRDGARFTLRARGSSREIPLLRVDKAPPGAGQHLHQSATATTGGTSPLKGQARRGSP